MYFTDMRAQRNLIPLEDYFSRTEEHFGVKFSYSVILIKPLKIEPVFFEDLAGTLAYLESKTHFTYEIADNRYVMVVPIKNTQPISLSEVVITNYLVRGINKNKNGSFTLKNKETETLPGLVEPDVLQTVQVLPGIESANETISNINIRGGSHDQNLILWNGIKMFHTGHFFGLISAFNPYVTDQTEIIKNGASSRYGDAVSGIIDMRSDVSNKNRSTAGAGANLLSADAFMNYNKNKKLTVRLSGRHSTTDLFSSPILDAYLKRTLENTEFTGDTENTPTSRKFLFYDITGTASYRWNKNHLLRADFIRAFDDLAYNEISPSNFKDSRLTQKSQGAKALLESEWGKTHTELETYISTYDLYGKNTETSSAQTIIQENSILETALKAGFVRPVYKNSTLSGGYQFIETGIKNAVNVNLPHYIKSIKEVMRVHSVFLEGTYEQNKTYVRLGTRLNYLDKLDQFILEPRLSINQYLTNHLSVKLQGEFKSQSTTQIIELQQDFFGIEKRRWMLSNGSSIPVIRSKQLSLGADYKKNGWLISTEAFYKYVNGISTKTQGFNNQIAYVNAVGTYNVYGFEYLLSKQTANVNTWISYTLSKNNYTFKTLTPPEFPNNTDIRHSLDAAISYQLKQIAVSLGYKYRTGAPYTTPEPGNQINYGTLPPTINYSNPNDTNLKDYSRVDISCNYSFLNKKKYKGSITLALLNVFNTKNTLNSYYRLNADDSEVIRVNNYSLGFSPNASVRFSF